MGEHDDIGELNEDYADLPQQDHAAREAQSKAASEALAAQRREAAEHELAEEEFYAERHSSTHRRT